MTMQPHRFGGRWTDEKLARLGKYLHEHMKIFTVNERARHFETVYVDAFAGSGSWVDTAPPAATSDLFGPSHSDDQPESEDGQLRKGSAEIALRVEPPFGRYVFIEKNRDRVTQLEQLQVRFPRLASRIEIACREANAFLQDWCRATDWHDHRAVVFLDPYGMQVEWATLERIAKTRAIDLWFLFPLGVAVNRLLMKKDTPPDVWARALTRLFGTEEWLTEFYREQEQQTLWGPVSAFEKHADCTGIAGFFKKRLESIFTRVANNPLPLTNSTGCPLYLLCFAAGNPKGADTAVRIAQHLLKA